MQKFGCMTSEKRVEILKLAREAVVLRVATREANKHLYKTSYMDESYWASLGTKYGVRMENINDPATPKLLRKCIRKAHITTAMFNEVFTSIDYFVEKNPKWTGYAIMGLCLEIRDGIEQ